MERPRDALPEGTKLAGYVIGRVLGRGGFGVTYLGRDALFPESKVAIKEFFPAGLAVRDLGTVAVHPSGTDRAVEYAAALRRFEDEARALVALRHPNVVEVQRYIEANGTAYVVMKFEEGKSLANCFGRGESLSANELLRIVPPLLDGLEAVHDRNYLHRDIKPDNIYIRAADGSPVLLDFGAARQAIGAERKTSLTEIVTPGYAPFEQYFRKGEQGPWTDIYALGATFYRCVAGERPPDAPERVHRDEMIPAGVAGAGRYPTPFLAGIDAMLAVDTKRRPQSVHDARSLLLGERPAEPPSNVSSATLVAGAPKAPDARAMPSFPAPPDPGPIEVNLDALSKFKWGERAVPREKRFGATLILLILAAVAGLGYLFWPSNSPVTQSNPAAAPVAQSADACRDGSTWRAGCVFRECADCPELVVVPAGTFLMGSVNNEDWRATYEGTQPEAANVFSLLKYESPQHRVTIPKPLAIGRYEVTFAEYDACNVAGACAYRPDDKGWGRGQRPVISLLFEDAKAYAAWMSRRTGKTYRLPSEAEWEYAARAGTTTRFFWGDGSARGRANCLDCGTAWNRQTSPVGSFAPNAFGLFDVHGNVWEQVEDCWNENYTGAPTDGRPWLSGDCARRVVRGGGYLNFPGAIRAAVRVGQDVRSDIGGFRIARVLD